jgi:gamma-F420-2:alpha-L-glutamate ligase
LLVVHSRQIRGSGLLRQTTTAKKPPEVWILTKYKASGIGKELTTFGAKVHYFNPNELVISIGDAGPGLMLRNIPLQTPDIVLARIGAGIGPHAAAVIQHLEWTKGVPVINSLTSIRRADKIHAAMLVSREGIEVPRTLVHTAEGGPSELPFESSFVKLTGSSKGAGVVPCERQINYRQVAQLVGCIDRTRPLIVQADIADRPGDCRVFLLGGKVVGTKGMRRKATVPGERRANAAQGGKGEAFELDPETISLAEKITCLIGLEICGLDMLWRGDNYRVFLEANASPAYSEFRKATGINVARLIAEYLLSRLNT